MSPLTIENALRALFWLANLLLLLPLVLPTRRFLRHGWRIRKQEFVSSLARANLEEYLNRFWYQPPTDPQKDTNGAEAPAPMERFCQNYDSIVGQHLFGPPLVLLCLMFLILDGLALQTALRIGYENGVTANLHWQEADKPLSFGLTHLPADMLDRAFLPFAPISLDFSCIAAIAGAYLFIVNQVICGNRTRTLVSSDLFSACLRLVISIPMGLGLGQLFDQHLAAFAAFALGAFPISGLIGLTQRLFNMSLKIEEKDNSDRLIVMQGMTPTVSAALGAEGITAVQQLADQDPVSLALRAGLSFDYMMNLVAQAQAWSFIGPTAGVLAPLDLGDARPIARLIGALNSGDAAARARAGQTLAEAATATKIGPWLLETAFRDIAADSYTVFLLAFERSPTITPVVTVPNSATIQRPSTVAAVRDLRAAPARAAVRSAAMTRRRTGATSRRGPWPRVGLIITRLTARLGIRRSATPTASE